MRSRTSLGSAACVDLDLDVDVDVDRGRRGGAGGVAGAVAAWVGADLCPHGVAVGGVAARGVGEVWRGAGRVGGGAVPRAVAGVVVGRLRRLVRSLRSGGCCPARVRRGGFVAGRGDREPGSPDAVPGQVRRSAVRGVPVDRPATQGQLHRPVRAGDGAQRGRRDALEPDRAALRDEHGRPGRGAGVHARARRGVGGVAVEPVERVLAFVEHCRPDLGGVVRGQRHPGRSRADRRRAVGGAGRVADRGERR